MQRTLDAILNKPTNKYFRPVNDFFALLTIISVLGIVIETVPGMQEYDIAFNGIEYIAVAFFTVEYLARLYAAKKKWRYVFSFFGIIDLLSIVPTFLGFVNLTFLKSARVLRILRLLRMLRLAKIARLRRKPLADAEHDESVYRINIQIYFTALFAAILVLGASIYVIEAQQQSFDSIPAGMMWSAEVILGGGITTTYPETVGGQLLGLVARFIGLVLLGVLIHVVGHTLKRWLFGKG